MTEGERIGESDEKGWYSTSYSNEITDKQLSEYPEILKEIEYLTAKAETLKNMNLIDCGFQVEDYGEDYLYLPYTNADGSTEKILLCKVGAETAILEDNDVQILISMLCNAGLFSKSYIIDTILNVP